MAWHSIPWSADRLPALVDLLQESFSEVKSVDHVTWKHLDGPWGPSRGRLAVDDEGRVLGVRLFTPWGVRWGSDQTGTVLRAMDGAVAAAARRQGIFAGLVEAALLDEVGGNAIAALSSCVPASREAYRKLGWAVFAPQARAVAVPGVTTARTEEIDPSAVPVPDAGARLQTDWQPAALAWRVDPRSGYEYSGLRLRSSDVPQGLLYRVSRRGRVRRLVVLLAAGPSAERRRLVAAAARRHRCPVVVHDGALAEPDGSGGMRLQRTGSVLAVWSPQASPATIDPGRRESWSLQGADLEGVL